MRPAPSLRPPLGMMEVLPFELPLPSKWSGVEFDGFFFMVDCYVEEYAAYKFFDSIEAIDFLSDLARLWATLPHEEFIYGGKHKPRLKELVARGMALLILLNGELELWGKKFLSPYINLPNRYSGAVPKHLPRKESV